MVLHHDWAEKEKQNFCATGRLRHRNPVIFIFSQTFCREIPFFNALGNEDDIFSIHGKFLSNHMSESYLCSMIDSNSLDYAFVWQIRSVTKGRGLFILCQSR